MLVLIAAAVLLAAPAVAHDDAGRGSVGHTPGLPDGGAEVLQHGDGGVALVVAVVLEFGIGGLVSVPGVLLQHEALEVVGDLIEVEARAVEVERGEGRVAVGEVVGVTEMRGQTEARGKLQKREGRTVRSKSSRAEESFLDEKLV